MKKKIINVIVILIISACMLMIGAKAATTILSSTVTYKDTTVEKALDELISKTYQCPGKEYNLCTNAKVGDYVTDFNVVYSSFTIPASMTGYDTDQTINPSELNLWRIISINNDGTIDIISEYTSSTPVYFKGKEGFKNFVSTLNYIATAYYSSSDPCIVNTRHMGYRGQMPILLDSTANLNSIAGIDYDYTYDTNLVKTALGTLKAYKQGTTTGAEYWLASRYVRKIGSIYGADGRIVDPDGIITHIGQEGYGGGTRSLWSGSSGIAASSTGFAAYIRPILTIEASASIYSGGNGTKEQPWRLDA